MQPCGYHHRDYAFSLSEYGDPIKLERSGGWLLQRPILGSKYRDAMGCYPLLTCDNWNGLFDDLGNLKNQMVAVWMITDPFADLSFEELSSFFTDVCFLFKHHIVVDLSQSRDAIVSKHHKRYAQKSLNHVEISMVENPEACVGDWERLYRYLIEKHEIKGLTRFSTEAFSKQLKVPGCVVFQAFHEQRVVAMQIWYRYHDRAYYHLGASSEEGYRQYAAFGLFWEAIDYFKRLDIKWLSLGAGAGVKPDSNDGLTRFKKGWSNETLPVYFCGAVMNINQYKQLCSTQSNQDKNYFPAYRAGEFK